MGAVSMSSQNVELAGNNFVPSTFLPRVNFLFAYSGLIHLLKRWVLILRPTPLVHCSQINIQFKHCYTKSVWVPLPLFSEALPLLELLNLFGQSYESESVQKSSSNYGTAGLWLQSTAAEWQHRFLRIRLGLLIILDISDSAMKDIFNSLQLHEVSSLSNKFPEKHSFFCPTFENRCCAEDVLCTLRLSFPRKLDLLIF